jgi:predicted Zn-dependent protease
MLERALRIEPRNPWLWHRLAVLRLQQGEWRQALELATKSNTLSNDYPRLLMGNWKVISMALEHLGDGDGAREAQARSEDYRQQVND